MNALRAIANCSLQRHDVEDLLATKLPHSLADCEMEECDLSRLDLSHWAFERCILRNAKLVGARLANTLWRNCKASGADFRGTDLEEATFRTGDYSNTSFRRAKAASTAFTGCKLTGADLSEISALGLVFEEVLLMSAKLPAFSFRKSVLRRLNFTQADLRQCDFREAIFEECSLRDANLVDARFEGADLRGADLGGLKLADTRYFKGATISKGQAGQLLAELGLRIA